MLYKYRKGWLTRNNVKILRTNYWNRKPSCCTRAATVNVLQTLVNIARQLKKLFHCNLHEQASQKYSALTPQPSRPSVKIKERIPGASDIRPRSSLEAATLFLIFRSWVSRVFYLNSPILKKGQALLAESGETDRRPPPHRAGWLRPSIKANALILKPVRLWNYFRTSKSVIFYVPGNGYTHASSENC